MRLSLFAFTISLLLLACSPESIGGRRAYVFIVPPNFQGWVRIVMERPGAPPLPIVDGKYRVEVPVSGVVETSTKLEEGFARDEFYMRSPAGLDRLGIDAEDEANARVWGDHTRIVNDGERLELQFFVGRLSEWERTPAPH